MTENGKKAIDMLKKDAYDILILDLNMPKLNGIDVLKKIKKLEIPTETIILTAHATVSKAVEAMKLGAADYVVKPWDNQRLLATISTALKLRQSRSEASRLRQSNRVLSEATGRKNLRRCAPRLSAGVRRAAANRWATSHAALLLIPAVTGSMWPTLAAIALR